MGRQWARRCYFLYEVNQKGERGGFWRLVEAYTVSGGSERQHQLLRPHARWKLIDLLNSSFALSSTTTEFNQKGRIWREARHDRDVYIGGTEGAPINHKWHLPAYLTRQVRDVSSPGTRVRRYWLLRLKQTPIKKKKDEICWQSKPVYHSDFTNVDLLDLYIAAHIHDSHCWLGSRDRLLSRKEDKCESRPAVCSENVFLTPGPSGRGLPGVVDPAPACTQECSIEKVRHHKPFQPFQTRNQIQPVIPHPVSNLSLSFSLSSIPLSLNRVHAWRNANTPIRTRRNRRPSAGQRDSRGTDVRRSWAAQKSCRLLYHQCVIY